LSHIEDLSANRVPSVRGIVPQAFRVSEIARLHIQQPRPAASLKAQTDLITFTIDPRGITVEIGRVERALSGRIVHLLAVLHDTAPIDLTHYRPATDEGTPQSHRRNVADNAVHHYRTHLHLDTDVKLA
jgi:hypothetical protein